MNSLQNFGSMKNVKEQLELTREKLPNVGFVVSVLKTILSVNLFPVFHQIRFYFIRRESNLILNHKSSISLHRKTSNIQEPNMCV